VTSIDAIRTDPALQLKMPGSFLSAANQSADSYFAARAAMRLSQAAPHCLCTLLEGAPHVLAEFCTLEIAYNELRSGRTPEPRLMALRGSTGKPDTRTYELFLIHARLAADDELVARLLPLPSGMTVRISDETEQPIKSGLDLVNAPDYGVRVEIPNLLPSVSYRSDDLKRSGQLDTLRDASLFYSHLLGQLRYGHDPPRAWQTVRARSLQMSERVPAPVAAAFAGHSGCCRAEAVTAIENLWQYPLDAPVLSCVLPQILSVISRDHNLLLAPEGSDADRARYFRLHIPIRDIEEEDSYFGWLPSFPPADWDDGT
jgi:hypothetical protein